MHPHRTGAACCCAVRADSPPGHAAGEHDDGCIHRPRVLGLGAPLTVLIRPDACETPFLRAEVLARLAKHDREPAQADTPARDWWAEERAVWKMMLSGLDTPAGSAIELMWPTVHAHDVLLGALRRAVARLKPPASRDKTQSLREALATACACFATWKAFLAVDDGGLQDVTL